jgi:hypothetical protein
MSDVWYYAIDDKTIGPLSLAELTAIFSRDRNARDLLVWRAGFVEWQRAATVPELAACVVKPPPLPPSQPIAAAMPQVLPPDQMLRVGNQNALQKVQSSGSRRRHSVAPSFIVLLVIATLITGARFLVHSTPTISKPDPASMITGKDRDEVVSEGMKSCMRKQENDPDNKTLSLSKETLTSYCSCYMNAIADATEPVPEICTGR